MLTQKFRWSIPAEFNLLSTDTKPTDCPNGSRINEIDTGKVYLFDEENKVWYEKSNSGGGGGGGGSVTVDTTVNGASANPVQNKAIYDFVNSSVSTNTADFIGTFNSVAELEAYSGTVTNNDYAFVISTDSAGNTAYNRYKYNGSTWVFEYALNNSSFTAAQWATIQSGLTATDKTKLDGIEAGANKTVVDANLSQTSTNPVQNKVVNDALATKQDTIADLADIRSGAAAGATAVQPADMSAALTLKQDKLTFDSAPTESSTNPVTSGGVWTDQQRQETEIGAVANAGSKNRLKLSVESKTVDGVTYTLQSDGCIIANGRAAASSVVASFYGGQFTLPAGDWLLNGCPSGGATASYMVQIKDNSNPENPAAGTVLYRDFGTGDVLISINTETTFMYVIRVANGYTVNNVMFKPMIRRAEITDDTFVPYAPTNRELYEMILALQAGT